MTQTTSQRLPMAGIHHFSATVTDVEASAAWYQRVLGLQRIPPRVNRPAIRLSSRSVSASQRSGPTLWPAATA